jgi:hypothetical protein
MRRAYASFAPIIVQRSITSKLMYCAGTFKKTARSVPDAKLALVPGTSASWHAQLNELATWRCFPLLAKFFASFKQL